ncbi:hypothetical protein VP14_060 [Vibrio phage VPMCC14]|nr:hypothetical protein VP14_060 [Vibrio phage VPMCC14]
MKTKFELKMKMKQFERQKDDVKSREQNFRLKTDLVDKAKGSSCYKKAFELMENARTAWWKSIDKKLELEQEIKILEKKLIAEIMEEVE